MRKKKIKNIKQYFALFVKNCLSLVFVCLVVISISLTIGCNKYDSLTVLNKTNGDIVVTGAWINEEKISTKRLIVPFYNNRFQPMHIYAMFNSGNKDILMLSLINSTKNHVVASCELEKKGAENCFYKISYVGSDQLKCVCDSYSVFSD